MLASMKINPEKSFLLFTCKCLNAIDLFYVDIFHLIWFLCVYVCEKHPILSVKAQLNVTSSICSWVRCLIGYGAVVCRDAVGKLVSAWNTGVILDV